MCQVFFDFFFNFRLLLWLFFVNVGVKDFLMRGKEVQNRYCLQQHKRKK